MPHDKLIEKPCPICRHDYQYQDEDGIWCPHCGARCIDPVEKEKK